MPRYAKLQFVGPLAVFFAVLAAEAAAVGLWLRPTSEMLWRVNLEYFSVFQKSHYLLGPTIGFPFSQCFWALALLIPAIYGLQTGRALALAVASNLSFVYTAFLIYVGISAQSHPLAASLVDVPLPIDPGDYLPLVLVTVSLLSAALSHLHYLRRISGRP
jgi:hypothetical protein